MRRAPGAVSCGALPDGRRGPAPGYGRGRAFPAGDSVAAVGEPSYSCCCPSDSERGACPVLSPVLAFRQVDLLRDHLSR